MIEFIVLEKQWCVKVTPGVQGTTVWYQSLGIRISRELRCGVHAHGLVTSFTTRY